MTQFLFLRSFPTVSIRGMNLLIVNVFKSNILNWVFHKLSNKKIQVICTWIMYVRLICKTSTFYLESCRRSYLYKCCQPLKYVSVLDISWPGEGYALLATQVVVRYQSSISGILSGYCNVIGNISQTIVNTKILYYIQLWKL